MKSAGLTTVYPAGLCCCGCLASVLCVTTPSDVGDRRLFTLAFQVGRLRCARRRGLLNAKSHFTLVLMSPGEWRGVRTGRWCLQMRTPQTASRPDTRCWFDYGTACRRAYECMEQVRWRIQSRLSETETSVASVYLDFVQLEVSATQAWDRVFPHSGVMFVIYFCFFSSWGNLLPCEAALCVLGVIAHSLQPPSVCVDITLAEN